MKVWLVFIVLSMGFLAKAQEPQGVPKEIIDTYPAPNVNPLVVQETHLYDRIYRRVTDNLAMYDSPGGSLAQNWGVGFNYVTLLSEPQGDWTQITQDRWVATNTLSTDVAISRFAGVRLDEELPYPMAWLLRHVRPSSAPGLDQDPNNPFLYRYTRVSLYSFVEIDGFRWYQIGINQWVHQFNVAKIVPIEKPEGVETSKWVSIDLYEQVLIAYEDEKPVFSTLISSGLPQWSTNEGLFNVYVRYERTLMSGAYDKPDFYYLEEVPYTMYFDGDIGLHGTYWHDGFGYRQSHGCVNLSITDARWLYGWSSDTRDFSNPESKDLSVYVYSSGEYQ